MSKFLRILEDEVQIVALAFMATVYTIRLIWMFRFKTGKEVTKPVGSPRVGADYSMMNVAMPWAMESSRKNLSFYVDRGADFGGQVIERFASRFKTPVVMVGLDKANSFHLNRLAADIVDQLGIKEGEWSLIEG